MRRMRRLAEWAARLYPEPWRRRYGAELEALLDDLDPGWRDVASLVRGGMVMRLTNPGQRMQKRMFAAGSCVVAALALAAADDLTTGSEPTFLGEWLMLAFAAAWFLAVGAWVRRQRAS